MRPRWTTLYSRAPLFYSHCLWVPVLCYFFNAFSPRTKACLAKLTHPRYECQCFVVTAVHVVARDLNYTRNYVTRSSLQDRLDAWRLGVQMHMAHVEANGTKCQCR